MTQMTIANKFREFFTNVVQTNWNLAKKLPPSNISLDNFLTNRVSQSIFLKPVTEDEIKRLSTAFKAGKASGFDGVNIADIKSNIETLAKPLSHGHVINLSISAGIVPNSVKLTWVIPSYKVTAILNSVIYMDQSLPSCFLIFFEKINYDRLISFIDKHNIIYEHQSIWLPLQLFNQLGNYTDGKPN